MGKELSEMTVEELWALFPSFLVQYVDKWNEYYKEIESSITDPLARSTRVILKRWKR